MQLRLTLCLLLLTVSFLLPSVAVAQNDIRVNVTAMVANPGSGPVHYSHYDCVAPQSPFTPYPDVLQTVEGFVFDAAKPIDLIITSLNVSGSGNLCPAPGGIGDGFLPHDYNGHYEIRAVCDGGSTSGATALDFSYDFIGGVPMTIPGAPPNNGFASGCGGISGTKFNLKVETIVTPTTISGVPIPPLGGIEITAIQ